METNTSPNQDMQRGFSKRDPRLAQPEWIAHSLQRAIYQGPLGPRRGPTHKELVVVSGSQTLLANIVIAFNARRRPHGQS